MSTILDYSAFSGMLRTRFASQQASLWIPGSYEDQPGEPRHRGSRMAIERTFHLVALEP